MKMLIVAAAILTAVPLLLASTLTLPQAPIASVGRAGTAVLLETVVL